MRRGLRLWVLVICLVLLVSACQGQGPTIKKYNLPKFEPIGQSSISLEGTRSSSQGSCTVRLVELIGAWVSANAPEADPFPFTDIQGNSCQGTFEADVLPAFTQANLWYPGALSCRTCHGPDVQVSYARLDMSSYLGIMAGSSRADVNSKGDDILGGGNWQESTLYEVLSKGEMPPNQPAGLNPAAPLVTAGNSR
jgi:hypothetical protein